MSLKISKQKQLEFYLSELQRQNKKASNKELALYLGSSPNEIAVMKNRIKKKIKKGKITENALTVATKNYDAVTQDLLLYKNNEEEFVKDTEKSIKFNILNSIDNTLKAYNKHVSKLANNEGNLTENDASLVTGATFSIINRKQAK